jgi:ribonuclease P protein component
MIRSINRFHGHNSLQVVYNRGQMVRGQFLGLKYLSNPRRQHFRQAVVVSRKVSKSAVVRNRIRRRLYEAIRLLSSQFGGVYDMVLLVYDEALAELPAARLTAEVEKIYQKAGILGRRPPSHDIVEAKE